MLVFQEVAARVPLTDRLMTPLRFPQRWHQLDRHQADHHQSPHHLNPWRDVEQPLRRDMGPSSERSSPFKKNRSGGCPKNHPYNDLKEFVAGSTSDLRLTLRIHNGLDTKKNSSDPPCFFFYILTLARSSAICCAIGAGLTQFHPKKGSKCGSWKNDGKNGWSVTKMVLNIKKVTIFEPFTFEVHFGTGKFGGNPSIFSKTKFPSSHGSALVQLCRAPMATTWSRSLSALPSWNRWLSGMAGCGLFGLQIPKPAKQS